MSMAISQKIHVKPTLSISMTTKVTAKQDRKLSDNDDPTPGKYHTHTKIL